MFCCGKNGNQQAQRNRMTRFRFSAEEVQELHRRFQRMTNGSNFLTKNQFRDNMGLLGLETVQVLSDCLFQIIDEDQDGKIQFNEFLAYFDKITYGSQDEKAEISYKLIDQNRKGYFTLRDFQQTMQALIDSWVVMTGTAITNEIRDHLEKRVAYIFTQMDKNNDEKVSFNEYKGILASDPSLLDIFEFLRKGITISIKEATLKQDQIVLSEFYLIKDQAVDLFELMIGLKPNRYSTTLQAKPNLISSLMFCQKKMRQNTTSQFGIQYLMGEEIDALSLRMSSTLNVNKNRQQGAIQTSQIICATSQIGPFIHRGDQEIPIKIDYNLQSKESEETLDPELTDGLEKINYMPEDQIRDNYKEALIKIHELKQQTQQSLDRLEKMYQKKLEEFNIKKKKDLEIAEKRRATIANINKKRKTALSVQFGHQNWNLVLNMMIGIQMAVKSVNALSDYEVTLKDFKLKYYFELMPKRTGNEKATFKVCKFFDYAPQVFNHIRKMFFIDNDNYLSSIGPETLLSSILKGDLSTLSELTSTGKSGSFFYYSQDGIYTLKTISKTEFTFMRHILYNYFKHLKDYRQSLIIKLFGMHKIILDDKKIHFIIMSNVFKTSHEINLRYDIKGSLHQRKTPNNADYTVARKDLNFLESHEKINIRLDKQGELLTQLCRDADFFAQNNIIDYSLLLGIHEINVLQNSSRTDLLQDQESEDISIIQSKTGDKIYFFGIIDILTNFNTKKKIEYCCKRCFQGPDISAIPPHQYAERFKRFITNMFRNNV
ncbi:unnamed protein product [Paramecium octaurelia]|uniref:Phosphatidylinositol-4-phosphate 5-kinase n=1 Tax=Paramecium octaurelia TaxID=43137 RepID=A0A8S1YFI7_PAROT|nr:unnamed protein product [Paramecium octaurelia]